MSTQSDDQSVTLTLPDGASTTIYLFGGHVTSWKTGDGEEHLYLSKKALFDGSKPIRGGIPICWPNFASGPTPSEVETNPALKPLTTFSSPGHSFARTQTWTPAPTNSTPSPTPTSASTTLTLPTSSYPESFPKTSKVSYTVTLRPSSLTSSLRIENPGNSGEEVWFKLCFHTYLSVAEGGVRVEGLREGAGFRDIGNDGKEGKWAGGDLNGGVAVCKMFVDVDAPGGINLRNGKGNLNVSWIGLKDVLCWNPGSAAGKGSYPDMEIGDEARFTCIEPGYMSSWKCLKPGEVFVGEQILSV